MIIFCLINIVQEEKRSTGKWSVCELFEFVAQAVPGIDRPITALSTRLTHSSYPKNLREPREPFLHTNGKAENPTEQHLLMWSGFWLFMWSLRQRGLTVCLSQGWCKMGSQEAAGWGSLAPDGNARKKEELFKGQPGSFGFPCSSAVSGSRRQVEASVVRVPQGYRLWYYGP